MLNFNELHNLTNILLLLIIALLFCVIILLSVFIFIQKSTHKNIYRPTPIPIEKTTNGALYTNSLSLRISNLINRLKGIRLNLQDIEELTEANRIINFHIAMLYLANGEDKKGVSILDEIKLKKDIRGEVIGHLSPAHAVLRNIYADGTDTIRKDENSAMTSAMFADGDSPRSFTISLMPWYAPKFPLNSQGKENIIKYAEMAIKFVTSQNAFHLGHPREM